MLLDNFVGDDAQPSDQEVDASDGGRASAPPPVSSNPTQPAASTRRDGGGPPSQQSVEAQLGALRGDVTAMQATVRSSERSLDAMRTQLERLVVAVDVLSATTAAPGAKAGRDVGGAAAASAGRAPAWAAASGASEIESTRLAA